MAISLSRAQVGNHFDKAARSYLLALKAGQKPPERPNMGPRWEPLVSTVERAYNRSHGALDAIERAITSLCVTNPDFAELLADPTPPPSATVIESVRDRSLMPCLPESGQFPKELSRGACSWLDERYIPFSRQASPDSYKHFHSFTGLWTLSAAAAGRVYVQFGLTQYHSNLMIVFCGESSVFGKTAAAKVGKRVLTEAGLGFLLHGDKTTPQKLLSDMSGLYVDKHYARYNEQGQENKRRRLAMPGQIGIYYDEFGKFTSSILRPGSSSSAYVDMFLQIDECPEHYAGGNDTITRGTEPISYPYIALLGSMTPDYACEVARRGSNLWRDGFLSRFAFVCAPLPTPENVIISPFGRDILTIPDELIAPLKAWHQRLGVPHCEIVPVLGGKDGEPTGDYTIEQREDLPQTLCSMSDDAYQAWANYYSTLKLLCLSLPTRDLNGSYTRLADKALRMAIIMASLENNNRIEIRHWARAQEIAEQLREHLHEMYNQANMPAPVTVVDKTAQLENRIIDILQKRAAAGESRLTANKINTSYLKSPDISSDAVERTLRGLQRAGVVEMIPTKKSKFYTLVDSGDVEDEDHAEDMTTGLEIGGIEGWE